MVVVALLGGLVVWFTLFGLAFTRSSEQYHRDAVVPLLLLLVGAYLFGVLRPRLWAWSATALTLPTALGGAGFFYAVFAQGSGFEAEYLLQIGAVASAAFVGTAVGKVLSKVGQLERSPADGRAAQQAVAADRGDERRSG